MTTNRPTFTQTEAATVTGLSRSTIKRRRLANDFPNAYIGTDKQWRIPVEDLLAQGLSVSVVSPDGSQMSTYGPTRDLGSQPEVDVTALINRLSAAEAALAVERERNIGLQNVNSEIAKRADLAERALLMLEAPKLQPTPPPTADFEKNTKESMVVTDSPTPPARQQDGHHDHESQPRKKPWYRFSR